ncbi:MAG: CvpA family protein [Clostridia bacterium]|nr:CvpA family protein [Clostridia bacterium]
MNVVDLILFIVIAVVAIASARKGFLMTLFNIAAYIIAGIAAKIFSVPVAEYAYLNFFSEKLLNRLHELIPSGSVEGELTTVIVNAIETLPSYVQSLINQFVNPSDIINAGAEGGNAVYTVEMIEQTYLSPAVINVLGIVAMVLLFVLFVFILRILFSIINKGLTRKKHRFIRRTNTFLGAAFGAVKGTAIAALIAAILNIGAPVINNQNLSDFVNGSAICNMVAEILM